MNKYVAFLRGINVSKKYIKMEDLKKYFEELNFKSIQTYIQSGNVIFDSDISDIDILIDKIKAIILNKTQFDIEVIIKTPNDLKRIIENNPLINHKDFINNRMYITLLSRKPTESEYNKLSKYDNPNETYELKEEVLYIIYRNGYGNSKFNNTYIEKQLSLIATTRNWNTMLSVYGMVGE